MPCSWEIDNHPSSVSTSNFPVWVLAQLHILYTPPLIVDAKPYYPDGPIDMGIFNLENGSIGLHYKPNPSHKDMPPPVWILLPMLVFHVNPDIEHMHFCHYNKLSNIK